MDANNQPGGRGYNPNDEDEEPISINTSRSTRSTEVPWKTKLASNFALKVVLATLLIIFAFKLLVKKKESIVIRELENTSKEMLQIETEEGKIVSMPYLKP